MQQFTVPQFIDVEDKILGPLTTRQFLIMLVAAILMAISYRLFDFTLFLTVSIVIFLITLLFSFVKINSRPFHLFVLNLLQTMRRPNLRVWNKMAETPIINFETNIVKPTQKTAVKEVYKKSRLAELSLIVDTKGRYKGD